MASATTGSEENGKWKREPRLAPYIRFLNPLESEIVASSIKATRAV